MSGPALLVLLVPKLLGFQVVHEELLGISSNQELLHVIPLLFMLTLALVIGYALK